MFVAFAFCFQIRKITKKEWLQKTNDKKIVEQSGPACGEGGFLLPSLVHHRWIISESFTNNCINSSLVNISHSLTLEALAFFKANTRIQPNATTIATPNSPYFGRCIHKIINYTDIITTNSIDESEYAANTSINARTIFIKYHRK